MPSITEQQGQELLAQLAGLQAMLLKRVESDVSAEDVEALGRTVEKLRVVVLEGNGHASHKAQLERLTAGLEGVQEALKALGTDVSTLKTAKAQEDAYAAGKKIGIGLALSGAGATVVKLLDHLTK